MRRLIYKRLIYIIVVLAFSFLLTALSSAKAEGDTVIRVGCYDADQYLEVDKDGDYYGYGYDYLSEIAMYTGWKYVYVRGTWQECLDMLAAGQIDLIGVAQYSEARAKQFEYSRYEAGTEYAMLFVSEDNNAIYYDDYTSFEGLKIGFLIGNYQNERFADYAKRHHFTYIPLYYEGTEELNRALDEGEVDAILSSSLLRVTGRKLVAKLAPAPYFFIAQKGDEELIQELDDALERIQTIDAGFTTKLYDKYYGEAELNQLAFTRQEETYLQEHPLLRVAYNEDWNPIEYFNKETGTFDGISAGIMKLLSEKSGIRFEYIPVRDEREGVRKIAEGEADLLCGFPENYAQEIGHYGVVLTRPYLEVPVTLAVPSRISLDKVKNVAVPRNSMPLFQYVKDQFEDLEVVSYPDTGACIDAVLAKKADAVFENVYVLEQYAKNQRYGDMTPMLSLRTTLPICIGVGENQAPVLRSLLNKLIAQMSQDQIDELVVKSTMEGPYISTSALVRQFLLPVVFLAALLIFLIVYRSKKRAEQYAFVDSLTGHENETKFLILAEKLLQTRGYGGYAVVSLDIDKFKMINNMHSFETGNQILRGISEILSRELDSGELYCRKADDRFILLMKDEEDELKKRLNWMIGRIMAIPHELGERFQYTVSCGVYPFVDSDHDLHRAIGWANLARKKSKTLLQDRIVCYDDVMRMKATQEQEIENNMEQALKRGEFKVYFQPKIRLSDERMMGAEALVRWEPERGSWTGNVIRPDAFIPVFEKNGFILKLDLFVFGQVCRMLRQWIDEGREVFPVSVNLSRVHLSQRDFYRKYLEIIDKNGIPAELIEIELTESAIFENKDQMISLIQVLRQAGLAVSMDDFGTGYSSLNLIKDLPFNYIKLDKEFFNTATDSERGRQVIESVIYMAEKLHMTAIAEGVETKEQVEFLRSIHCEIVQGYYYAKPMPMKEFEQFMREEEDKG